MILAYAAQRRRLPHEFFKPLFVFPQLLQILFTAEFPAHVAGCPQAGITIREGALHGVREHRDHIIDVEFPVDQMSLIRGKDQVAPFEKLWQIEPAGDETRSHSRHHRRTIQIEAAMIRVQLIDDGLSHITQILRRRAFVNQTLMASVRGIVPGGCLGSDRQLNSLSMAEWALRAAAIAPEAVSPGMKSPAFRMPSTGRTRLREPARKNQ